VNTDAVDRMVVQLREAFPTARTAQDGARTLVRLPTVPFPEGCKPDETEALVVLTSGTAQPELYVRVIPLRPDGGTPRSTGTTFVGGESWCTFSFSVQWDENRHTAVQFVLARLARFGRNE
jgi:hypothetical protein